MTVISIQINIKKKCISHLSRKNTTFSSQIYGVKVFRKFYTPLLLSTNREGVPPRTDFELAKRLICRYKNVIIDSLLNIFLSFGWKVSLLFLVLNDKKLSSHIDQTSQHINIKNHKIYSFYQMKKKLILHLGSQKGDTNDDSSLKLTDIYN